MTRPREERRAEFEGATMPHVHSLHNVALRLTRRAEEAEDLVQETLLRAYRFYDRYEAGTNIRAWLFKILRNLFINRYRHDQRRPDEVDIGGAEETLDLLMRREAADRPGLSTPEQILLDGSLDEEVERALRELPEEYRLVLLLTGLEGMSYKEIAAALDVPIGTVMSRLHRARRLMQAKLMDYAREHGLAPAEEPGAGGRVVRLSEVRLNRKEAE